jgi:acetoin utilization protein AcuB
MSKSIPTIQKYMTTTPYTVRPDLALAAADKIMHEHNIRHLPVLNSGQLVGLLSQRDIRLIESFKDVDIKEVQVVEAMSPEVFEVAPDAPLDEVVLAMAAKKFGSAVVTQNGKVVGIFTTVDALQTLAELLQTRLAR